LIEELALRDLELNMKVSVNNFFTAVILYFHGKLSYERVIKLSERSDNIFLPLTLLFCNEKHWFH